MPVGARIILGASTKDDDWKRWTGAEKYVKEGVILLPPEETAVSPTVRPNGEPYSATAFRNALGDPENNKDEIADFVGIENVDNVLKTLGLVDSDKVEETTVASAIAGGLGTVPLESGSDKRKRPKKKPANENIAIANEVLRLITERGILR